MVKLVLLVAAIVQWEPSCSMWTGRQTERHEYKTKVTLSNFDTDGMLQLIPATYLEYWSLKLTEDRCYQ
jgi:hypothetical protein